MSTHAVTALEKRPETSFSLRFLLLVVAAVSVGLATARLPLLGYHQGFHAAAGVLVVAHLLGEIKLLRSHTELDLATRRFHVAWRCCILVCIALFFLLAFVLVNEQMGNTPLRRRFLARSIFIGNLSLLDMVLQLAILSHLMLGLPSVGKIRWRLILLAAILSASFVLYSYGEIFLLVQIAIEAVEFSFPGVHHGELSQYAEDAGTMYAGVEPNLQIRRTNFVRASFFGAIAALLAVVYCFAIVARGRLRPQSARQQTALLLPGFVLAGAYPCWIYWKGLANLCPPYAIAGFSNGALPVACGVVSLLLVAILLSYRFRPRVSETHELPELPLTTLFMIAIASLVILGLFQASTWSALLSFSFDPLPYFLSSFNSMIALATLIILVPKIYFVLLHMHGSPRPIGHIEPSSMRTVFLSIIVSVVLIVPNAWWLSYAFRLSLIHR